MLAWPSRHLGAIPGVGAACAEAGLKRLPRHPAAQALVVDVERIARGPASRVGEVREGSERV